VSLRPVLGHFDTWCVQIVIGHVAGILCVVSVLALTRCTRAQEERALAASWAGHLEEGPGSAAGGWEAEAEEDEDAYTDRRWRRISLVPFGDAWLRRCEELAQCIAESHPGSLLPDLDDAKQD
jgi:hypothetical protein